MSAELSFSLLILRLGLAVTFFAHGAQQLLGWYGGKGFKPTIDNWKEKYQIPKPIGAIGILNEFFGSFLLVVGYLVRPVALGLVIFMAVAIWKAHWGNGFFMSRGPGQGSGIEFCLALLLMSLALLIGGAGSISMEWLLG
ncbi:MAG: DoxX family membrane protein [Deltaproteobacteria bacterium]|nr:DoxX family membrane protein [Deltaproteobacteria bacterium]